MRPHHEDITTPMYHTMTTLHPSKAPHSSSVSHVPSKCRQQKFLSLSHRDVKPGNTPYTPYTFKIYTSKVAQVVPRSTTTIQIFSIPTVPARLHTLRPPPAGANCRQQEFWSWTLKLERAIARHRGTCNLCRGLMTAAPRSGKQSGSHCKHF